MDSASAGGVCGRGRGRGRGRVPVKFEGEVEGIAHDVTRGLGRMTLETETPLGRGRGRGTDAMKLPVQTVEMKSSVAATNAPVLEDNVDGCVVQKQHAFPINNTLDLHHVDKAKHVKKPDDIQPKPTVDAKAGNKSDTLPALSEVKVKQRIKIISVDMLSRQAVVKFLDNGLQLKCYVQAFESPLMERWLKENCMTHNRLVEKSLLSALEITVGCALTPSRLERKPKEEDITLHIDVFKHSSLRQPFLESVRFFSLPILPLKYKFTNGVITNFEHPGIMDVVINKKIWIGLRNILLKVQMDMKLFGPRCAALQDLFLELFLGFGEQDFLAAVDNSWRELARVKVIGVEFDRILKVLYIDSGKVASINTRLLALPLSAQGVPELLINLPPQAIKLHVDKLVPSMLSAIPLVSSGLEGRVCYVQVLDDSVKRQYPLVNIIIASSPGAGAISIPALIRLHTENKTPQPHPMIKSDALLETENILKKNFEEWKVPISLIENAKLGSGGNACCCDKKIGPDSNKPVFLNLESDTCKPTFIPH